MNTPNRFTAARWVALLGRDCAQEFVKATEYDSELTALRARLESNAEDWAHDHTHLQKLCLKAGVPFDKVNGDSYGVPGITDLADMLLARLAEVEAEAKRLTGTSDGWKASFQSKDADFQEAKRSIALLKEYHEIANSDRAKLSASLEQTERERDSLASRLKSHDELLVSSMQQNLVMQRERDEAKKRADEKSAIAAEILETGASLTKQNAQLRADLAEIQRDRDNCRREMGQTAAIAITTVKEAERERDEAKRDLELMTNDRNGVMKMNAQLRADLDDQIQQRREAQRERDEAQRTYSVAVKGWNSENARLRADLATAHAKQMDCTRFESSPCYICGYNGPGYYQPQTHKCAEAYHAARAKGAT